MNQDSNCKPQTTMTPQMTRRPKTSPRYRRNHFECHWTHPIKVSIRVLVFNIKYTLFLRVRTMPGEKKEFLGNWDWVIEITFMHRSPCQHRLFRELRFSLHIADTGTQYSSPAKKCGLVVTMEVMSLATL